MKEINHIEIMQQLMRDDPLKALYVMASTLAIDLPNRNSKRKNLEQGKRVQLAYATLRDLSYSIHDDKAVDCKRGEYE